MKKIIIPIIAFFGTLAVLWGMLLLSLLIPNSAIRDNMLSSALAYDGRAPYHSESGRLCDMDDSLADVILLNIAWNMGEGEPFAASLAAKYYDGNDGVTDMGENRGFYDSLFGAEPNSEYSRYWHGSCMLIRPLMLFTDVGGIKLIGFLTAAALLILDCVILIRRRHLPLAAAIFLSAAAVSVWNISLSLEYQPAFIICLAVLPLFILLENRGDTAVVALSVVSGAATAFFDFLTTETVTILLPLVAVITLRVREGRFLGLRKEAPLLIKSCCGWLAAYGGTFLVKWSLASAVMGEDALYRALSSAGVRFAGGAGDVSPLQLVIYAPLANISTLLGSNQRLSFPLAIAGAIGLAAAVATGLLLAKKRGRLPAAAALAVAAAIPYLRYITLANHSYLHEFFTYRAQAATIAAVAAIFICALSGERQAKEGKVKR